MDMVTLIMCAFVVIAALLDIQSVHSTGRFLPDQQPSPVGVVAPVAMPQPSGEVAEAAPAPVSDDISDRPQGARIAEGQAASAASASGSASGLTKEQADQAAADAAIDAETEQAWKKALAAEGLADRVAIQAKGHTITMQIQDEILFPIGDGDLGAGGQVVIRKLTPLLASASGQILVEGHTDDVPINNDRFASNWELSTTRAASVVRALIAAGIPAVRLRATGFADTRPVQSNDTEDGRAHNRRVTLVIER
jgi:chemotaxis protein MotB